MAEAEATQEGEAPAGAPTPPAVDPAAIHGFQVLPAAAPEAGEVDEETRRLELVKEFDARATRLAEAVDEALVLANDGTIRWLGDPIAKLAPGEEALKPRAIILADEALSPESREAVQRRVALWLVAHVRKMLGPLLALAEPEGVPDGARDLAVKLSQALGVLERERVRAQVKALDQNARAALRKLGVRFGALYIYVPALLKPGARALCAQLWALVRGDAEKEAVAERLLHFASSGRTSFAVEPPASGEVYRVAGFRLCGDRAVRVDIVERLMDLIRATLPRPGAGGPRSAGDDLAEGFAVTNQMTSLTGCSGDHFASILRSLGFAGHKVKKVDYLAAASRAAAAAPPPSPPTAEDAVPAAASDPATAAAEDATLEVASDAATPVADAPDVEAAAEVPTAVESEAGAPQAADLEETPAAPTAEEAAEADAADIEEPTAVDGETEAPPATVAEEASASAPAEPADAPAEDAPADASVEAAAPAPAASEEEMIEIWRPAPRPPRRGGHAAQRRPNGDDNQPAEGRGQWKSRRERRHGGPPRPAAEAAPAAAGTPPDAAPKAAREPSREDRRPPWRRDGAKGPRPERQEQRRSAEPARGDKGRPRPEPRQPTVNLDSPFAKLLDLKPLLKPRDAPK